MIRLKFPLRYNFKRGSIRKLSSATKNLAVLIISFGLLFGLVSEGLGADYTGIWMDDCSSFYGIQIKPTKDSLYSVSFCGYNGCFEPGEWTPNTPIEGDSNYLIVSPEKIGIKRKDANSYSYYTKCTSDATWKTAKPIAEEPVSPPDCLFNAATDSEQVLIAWITTLAQPHNSVLATRRRQQQRLEHFSPCPN